MSDVRDEIFSSLHMAHLKSVGFRKRQRRSERTLGKLHQAVACFSSRFSNSSEVLFTLEVRLGHDDYFGLFRPNTSFPGLTEQVKPLWSCRTKDLTNGNEKWWSFKPGDNVQILIQELDATLREHLLPFLEKTSTLDGFIELCRDTSPRNEFQALSWALFYADKMNEAEEVIAMAIEKAPHDNFRQLALSWREKLLAANSRFDTDAARWST